MSFKIEPCLPITKPGFFASIITILRCVSKMMLVISASSGTRARMVFSVSPSLNNID